MFALEGRRSPGGGFCFLLSREVESSLIAAEKISSEKPLGSYRLKRSKLD
jgi:hypothetical protein